MDAPRSALRCEDGGITDGRSVWPFKRLLAEGESTVQVANVPADLVLLTERAQTRFVGGADPALDVEVPAPAVGNEIAANVGRALARELSPESRTSIERRGTKVAEAYDLYLRAPGGAEVPLKEGMILSNEPGYYRDGAFGIRIENLIAVEAAPKLGDERDQLSRLYAQLTRGCGSAECVSRFCRSSDQFAEGDLDERDASIRAMMLLDRHGEDAVCPFSRAL